jgi:SAM-dependent methyltransferase
MNAPNPSPRTGEHQGRLWGTRAREWADHAEHLTLPLFTAVLEAAAVGPGTRYLDLGCGAGLACKLAAARGARVAGLDGSHELVAIARARVPDADLRAGEMEELPFEDAFFDVVTGFNSFQFAGDRVSAVTEARRVTRSGGKLGFGVWGKPEDCEAQQFLGALREVMPPPPPDAPKHGPLATDGVLDALLRSAGWRPRAQQEVSCPFVFHDLETALRALLAAGPVSLAIAHSGEERVRAVFTAALVPYKSASGGYRLENRFIYVLADAP